MPLKHCENSRKRRRLPVFLVGQDGAQQVKRRLTARPALLRVAARQLVLKAPFADVAIGLPAVLQVNAVGEAGRAQAGPLAAGIPAQVQPRAPVHELGGIGLDLAELEEVVMRVPAVVGALAPVGHLEGPDSAQLAHFGQDGPDGEIAEERLERLRLPLDELPEIIAPAMGVVRVRSWTSPPACRCWLIAS